MRTVPLALALLALFAAPDTTAVAAPRTAPPPVAVALLVPDTASFYADVDLEQGLKANPTLEVVRGYRAILERLTPGDRSALYRYDTHLVELAPWSADHAGAAQKLALGERERQMAPGLYEAIDQVLASFEANAATLPARRVLIVVSDAIDRTPAPALKATIAALGARAKKLGVRIHALGFTLIMDEQLAALRTLTALSDGSYAFIPFEGHTKIGDLVDALGQRAIGH